MEEEKIDILAFKVAKRDIKDTIAVQHEKEIYEELGDHSKGINFLLSICSFNSQ